MYKWKPVLSSVQNAFKSRQSTLLTTKAKYCDQGSISRTAILDKGIKLKRMTHVAEATVTESVPLSSSVKNLRLFVPSHEFTFRAGQWVDFLVPNVAEIAGYSICSSPRSFLESREIELAVKSSDFPPTKWVHSNCQVGDKVGLVVGGEFFYPSEAREVPRDLLLVAGGVGINPIISILRHVTDLRKTDAQCHPKKLMLMYSARSLEELIFKDEICDIVSRNDGMRAKFFLTRHNGATLDNYNGVTVETNRQMSSDDLSSALTSDFTDLKGIDCYVCGPSSMIDEVDRILLDVGVPPEQIRYEKWW